MRAKRASYEFFLASCHGTHSSMTRRSYRDIHFTSRPLIDEIDCFASLFLYIVCTVCSNSNKWWQWNSSFLLFALYSFAMYIINECCHDFKRRISSNAIITDFNACGKHETLSLLTFSWVNDFFLQSMSTTMLNRVRKNIFLIWPSDTSMNWFISDCVYLLEYRI